MGGEERRARRDQRGSGDGKSIGELGEVPQGNSNITIADNQITQCPVDGIYIAAARGVTVRGNRLSRVKTLPTNTVAEPTALPWTRN